MQVAVKAVLGRGMGYYKAATQFNVPQTTLERKVRAAYSILNKTSNENLLIPIKILLGPRLPVFFISEGDELWA